MELTKPAKLSDTSAIGEFGRLRQFHELMEDFADTAALIECCDLVISVDTSVAHLAGAMGKAVWILLPYVPDWRWLLDREDSPWYPTARLFRQQHRDNWSDVIDVLLKEVETLSDRLQTRADH